MGTKTVIGRPALPVAPLTRRPSAALVPPGPASDDSEPLPLPPPPLPSPSKPSVKLLPKLEESSPPELQSSLHVAALPPAPPSSSSSAAVAAAAAAAAERPPPLEAPLPPPPHPPPLLPAYEDRPASSSDLSPHAVTAIDQPVPPPLAAPAAPPVSLLQFRSVSLSTTDSAVLRLHLADSLGGQARAELYACAVKAEKEQAERVVASLAFLLAADRDQRLELERGLAEEKRYHATTINAGLHQRASYESERDAAMATIASLEAELRLTALSHSAAVRLKEDSEHALHECQAYASCLTVQAKEAVGQLQARAETAELLTSALRLELELAHARATAAAASTAAAVSKAEQSLAACSTREEALMAQVEGHQAARHEAVELLAAGKQVELILHRHHSAQLGATALQIRKLKADLTAARSEPKAVPPPPSADGATSTPLKWDSLLVAEEVINLKAAARLKRFEAPILQSLCSEPRLKARVDSLQLEVLAKEASLRSLTTQLKGELRANAKLEAEARRLGASLLLASSANGRLAFERKLAVEAVAMLAAHACAQHAAAGHREEAPPDYAPQLAAQAPCEVAVDAVPGLVAASAQSPNSYSADSAAATAAAPTADEALPCTPPPPLEAVTVAAGSPPVQAASRSDLPPAPPAEDPMMLDAEPAPRSPTADQDTAVPPVAAGAPPGVLAGPALLPTEATLPSLPVPRTKSCLRPASRSLHGPPPSGLPLSGSFTFAAAPSAQGELQHNKTVRRCSPVPMSVPAAVTVALSAAQAAAATALVGLVAMGTSAPSGAGAGDYQEMTDLANDIAPTNLSVCAAAAAATWPSGPGAATTTVPLPPTPPRPSPLGSPPARWRHLSPRKQPRDGLHQGKPEVPPAEYSRGPASAPTSAGPSPALASTTPWAPTKVLFGGRAAGAAPPVSDTIHKLARRLLAAHPWLAPIIGAQGERLEVGHATDEACLCMCESFLRAAGFLPRIGPEVTKRSVMDDYVTRQLFALIRQLVAMPDALERMREGTSASDAIDFPTHADLTKQLADWAEGRNSVPGWMAQACATVLCVPVVVLEVIDNGRGSLVRAHRRRMDLSGYCLWPHVAKSLGLQAGLPPPTSPLLIVMDQRKAVAAAGCGHVSPAYCVAPSDVSTASTLLGTLMSSPEPGSPRVGADPTQEPFHSASAPVASEVRVQSARRKLRPATAAPATSPSPAPAPRGPRRGRGRPSGQRQQQRPTAEGVAASPGKRSPVIRCMRCQCPYRAKVLLLCEAKLPDGSTCPRACHTDCLRPPLGSVPPGAWYCSQHSALESGASAAAPDGATAAAQAATSLPAEGEGASPMDVDVTTAPPAGVPTPRRQRRIGAVPLGTSDHAPLAHSRALPRRNHDRRGPRPVSDAAARRYYDASAPGPGASLTYPAPLPRRFGPPGRVSTTLLPHLRRVAELDHLPRAPQWTPLLHKLSELGADAAALMLENVVSSSKALVMKHVPRSARPLIKDAMLTLLQRALRGPGGLGASTHCIDVPPLVAFLLLPRLVLLAPAPGYANDTTIMRLIMERLEAFKHGELERLIDASTRCSRERASSARHGDSQPQPSSPPASPGSSAADEADLACPGLQYDSDDEGAEEDQGECDEAPLPTVLLTEGVPAVTVADLQRDHDPGGHRANFLNEADLEALRRQLSAAPQIERLIADGKLTQAAARLDSMPHANGTPGQIAALRALHPPSSLATHPVPLEVAAFSAAGPTVPHASVEAPASAQDDASVRRLLGSGKRSAPGPDGWSHQLLLELVIDSVDLQLLIADLLRCIQEGAIPPLISRFLASAELVALVKDTEDDTKLRPLAISSAFRRMASSWALSTHSAAAEEAVGPQQLGLTRDGREIGIQNIRRAYENDPTYIVAAIDVKNAFNTVRRSAMLRQCHARISQLSTIVRDLYLNEGNLYFRHRNEEGTAVTTVLVSAEGAQQGDPLGGLLFALALRPVLDALVLRFPALRVVVAYWDDLVLVGPPAVVAAALAWIQEDPEGYLSIGLALAPGKTQFWSPCVVPEEVRALFPEALRRPPREGAASPFVPPELGLVIWGVPVGSPAFMSNYAATKSAAQLAALKSPVFQSLKWQSSQLLGRFCLYTRPRDLLRFLGQDIIAPAAQYVDDAIAEWFIGTYLGRPVTAHLKNYLAIPMEKGGFSLRTMAAAGPAARIAGHVDGYLSALSTRPHLAPAFIYPELDEPGASAAGAVADSPCVASELARAHAKLVELDDPAPSAGQPDTRVLAACLPSLGPKGIEAGKATRAKRAQAARQKEGAVELHALRGTQALLTRVSDKAGYAELVSAISPRERANLLSCSSTEASAFINTLPSPLSADFKRAKRQADTNTIIGDAWNNISNAQLQVAFERRLSLPHMAFSRPDLPNLDTCPRQGQGGQSCPATADEFGDHSRSCAHGPDRTHRHDVLVGALADILGSASSPANVSTDRHAILATLSRCPPVPGEPELPCPDILCHGEPPKWFDLTVVVSTLQSAISAGSSNTPGKAAAQREKSKLDHYARITGPGRPISTGRLIPAVLESGGRLGTALVKTLRTCAQLKVGADPTSDRLSPAAAAFYRIFTQQLSVTLQKLEADMILSDARVHYTRVAAPPTSDRQVFAGLPRDFTAADAFLATLCN